MTMPKPLDLSTPPLTIDTGCSIAKNGDVTLCNGQYFIAGSRINTPEKALAWMAHLGTKAWFDGMTMHYLIHKLGRRHGWNTGPL